MFGRPHRRDGTFASGSSRHAPPMPNVPFGLSSNYRSAGAGAGAGTPVQAPPSQVPGPVANEPTSPPGAVWSVGPLGTTAITSGGYPTNVPRLGPGNRMPMGQYNRNESTGAYEYAGAE